LFFFLEQSIKYLVYLFPHLQILALPQLVFAPVRGAGRNHILVFASVAAGRFDIGKGHQWVRIVTWRGQYLMANAARTVLGLGLGLVLVLDLGLGLVFRGRWQHILVSVLIILATFGLADKAARD